MGLLSGLIVFMVAVTGCGWVFKEEIEGLYDDYSTVSPQAAPMITPTNARKFAKAVFPEKSVHGTLYQEDEKAIEVIFYEAEPEFYQSVYLDPYSGKVLHVKDHLSGFFAFMLEGHMYLWLPRAVGGKVVSIAVFLFLFVLLSGLVLWWPKKRKYAKQRLTFKWKATTTWRRKNVDLHRILGFYGAALAFVLAFTGSVMAFNWFYYAVYKTAGGEKAPQFIILENSSFPGTVERDTLPIDRLIPLLKTETTHAKSYEIHYPHNDSSSIYVEIAHSKGRYYNSDYRFFDQYTLKEIETPSIYGKYRDAQFADKLIRMNYDIHVGAIGGLAGKILAFLASALIASLPLTGFLIWWGRRKRSEATTKKIQVREGAGI